jgi:Glycosyltransferase family 9 (heptosyltransferase)
MQPSISSAQLQYEQGVALYETRRYTEALAHFMTARELEPEYLAAHWNECITRLLLGDFKAGWSLHEARWQKNEGRWEPDPAKRGWRHLAQPLWVGDFSIAGKTVCLWAEQGFGDTLQFCRYAPLVQAMGAKVFLYVRAPIARLLSQSFAGMGIDVVADNQPLPPFDVHCPLMSLPLACGTDAVDKIPASIPYIFAKNEDVLNWKNRLASHTQQGFEGNETSKRVGLVWSGLMRATNPLAAKMDAERSIDFEFLKPLLSLKKIQWFSLQKDAELPESSGVINFTADLHDWADTAALIANLDLVISCDTAVAHLAASMGKPTWILSRYNGCWRWLDHRTDSPWYPSVRLFHQSAPGDWVGVVAEVMGALDPLSAVTKGSDCVAPRFY